MHSNPKKTIQVRDLGITLNSSLNLGKIKLQKWGAIFFSLNKNMEPSVSMYNSIVKSVLM